MNDLPRPLSQAPESTSTSLLELARALDPEAWRRLVDLYGPLVVYWCRREGLPEEDVADIFQEIFAAVAANLSGFRKDVGGSFRGWLFTITRNKIHDHFRRHPPGRDAVGGSDALHWLNNVPMPDETEHSAPRDEFILLQRALEMIRGDFEERSWQAFWQVVVEGRTAAEVAQTLSLSVNAVYKARARVLARLRDELGDLIN